MPLTTADGSMGAPGGYQPPDENGVSAGAQPTGAGAADALSRSVSAGNPTSASVNMPNKLGRTLEVLSGGAYDPSGGVDFTPDANGRLTKFGMLSRLIGPMLQGGVIGLAAGKGHPGGGFGAANDYFDRQRAFQMQRSMLQRQLYNDQFKNALDLARTQHEVSVPPLTRVPNAIKGKDADGNDIYMALNPRTMQYEPIQGITPESNADYAATPTNQGIVTYDKHGSAPTRLLTLPTGPPQSAAASGQPGPDGNAATSIPTTPPSQFNSGSPRVPGSGTANQSPSGINAAASTGSIPLRPPNFGKPKPTIRASRNAAGVEQDHMIDTDPDSPTFGQDLGTVGTSRQPLPDRTAGREDARANQKNDDTARAEQYAGAALDKVGGDPDKAISYLNGLKVTDPKAAKDFNRLLPQIRKSITDRAKSRKPKSRNALGLSDQQLNDLLGSQPDQNDEQ